MICPIKFNKVLLLPKHWPTWLGVLLLYFISLLPLTIRHKIGNFFGGLAYKYNHKRRKIAKANLKLCFPEFSKEKVNKLVRENFNFSAIGMLEIGQHVFASKSRLVNMLVVDNKDYLDQAIKQHGTLLLLLHSTMLDFIAIGTNGYNGKGSYKPFNNKVVDWLVHYARCRFASGLMAREDGFRAIIRELKNKRLVVYLPDEDFGFEQSTMVKFFAADKATLNAPARLSKITGCLAIPIMLVWDDKIKKYRMKSLPALNNYPSGDAAQDARALNASLETLIEPHIAQYMWTLKLFKTRPDGEASLY